MIATLTVKNIFEKLCESLKNSTNVKLTQNSSPRPKQAIYTGSIVTFFVLMTSKFGKKKTNLNSRALR